MIKLRLQIFFWKQLGFLAILARDVGQRCYELYEQHSPMKIVTDAPQTCMFTRDTCPYIKLWQPADEGMGRNYATEAKP
jgi:hypothetical protein